jgi:hypothetical protein
MSSARTVVYRPIPEEIIPDKRLGRHIKRDSRSLAYPYQRSRPESALADQLWERMIAILNQGNVGACTGNEETGVLGTRPIFDALPAGLAALDENFALGIYSDAETIDGDGPYPPNDNGSSGTSVAQVALNRRLISGYTHASSAQDMADALQAGPVGIGINWYSSFDSPDASGLVSVSSNAYVRGGHEVEVRGVDIAARLFHADNSWGTSWGLNGSFTFTWETMDRLLSEQGDCTVCVPLSAPAPVPVPVPVSADELLWAGGAGQQLPGGLKAWCAEHRTRADLKQLQADALAWAKAGGLA